MKYEVIIKDNDSKKPIGTKLPGTKYVNRYLDKIKSLNKFNNNYVVEVHEVN